MKLLLVFSAITLASGHCLPAVFALNEEAEAVLDMLYEQGRAASEEELMEILISIAGDESLERKEKVKEMNRVFHLVGGKLSEEEKRTARHTAFKAVDRTRVEAFLARHPELEERTREAIRAGRIEKGMSKEEVEASLGKPEKITKVLRRSGFDERWDYFSKRRFVFFEGDTVRAWKE